MPDNSEPLLPEDQEDAIKLTPNPTDSPDPSGSRRLEPKEGEVLPRHLEPEQNRTPFESELYQGLLPHPDHLERFEQLAPGAAERFMQWVEDEAKHRRDVERRGMELHYESQQLQLRESGEIQRETLRTELAQTKVETSTQFRVAMGAHAVALALIFSGTMLFILGKDGGAVALGAVGVIYTSGTIAGIFRREAGKPEPEKTDSTAIEKRDE